MDLYKKTHNPKNKKGKLVALICLLSGILLFVAASAEFVLYASLVQFVGLLFVTAAVYIASAYLLREYTYSVEKNSKDSEIHSENYDFLIRETKSKKQIKVCHFEMCDITQVRVVDRENKSQVEKERKNMKRYTYDTEFASSKKIEINAELDGEKYSIFIAYDQELLNILSSFTN